MKKRMTGIGMIVLLAACSGANNWQGSDVNGHSYASFGSLSGKQRFKLQLDSAQTYYIKYTVQRQSGELHLLIAAGRDALVDKEVDTRLSDSLLVKHINNTAYTLTLSGKKAAGSYDVRYGIAGK